MINCWNQDAHVAGVYHVAEDSPITASQRTCNAASTSKHGWVILNSLASSKAEEYAAPLISSVRSNFNRKMSYSATSLPFYITCE